MIRRIADTQTETDFQIKKIEGINRGIPFESLPLGQFSGIAELNIFKGVDGQDKLRGRYGSNNIHPVLSPSKWSDAILSSIVYDSGGTDYLIAQIGTAFYSQNLTTPGNPTLINDFAGAGYVLGSSVAADLAMSGARILIGHPGGNAVIELISGTFKIRTLGMAYPWITTVDVATSGVLSGGWAYGIEKVYQISGVDVSVSSPNRKMITTRIISKTGTIASKLSTLTIQATELDNDTLWTHLRLWRTKNLNQVLTDPLNPIDPQGFEDELYTVALITKTEMAAGSLTAIATGSILPPGNVGVTVGKPGGVYKITDNNLDTVLFDLVGLDRIELSPILACNTLCVHKERTFFSNINSTTEDPTGSKVYYSNLHGSKWSELYDPQANFRTGYDGQVAVKLMSFESDLIILKEASTWRLSGGDVTQPAEVLDRTIGIPWKRAVGFIPRLGICALTSDLSSFQILGYDLRWTREANGLDISTPLQGYAVFTSSSMSFAFCNGRLFVSEASGRVFVLHVSQERGWTTNTYRTNTITAMHTFSGGSRILAVGTIAYTLEIDSSSYTQDMAATGAEETLYDVGFAILPGPFQVNSGRALVRPSYLSVVGELLIAPFIYALNGSIFWPAGSAVETYFTPSEFASQETDFEKMEYRAYVKPATVKGLPWTPWVGNRPVVRIYGYGQSSIESITMRAMVDETRSTPFGFDSFGFTVITPPLPEWITEQMCHLTFDENSTTARDSSGNLRHHAFTAGGGSRAYSSSYCNGGQAITGSATTYYGPSNAWTGLTNFGSKPISVGAVVNFSTYATAARVVSWGGDGTDFWAFFVKQTSGQMEFWYKTATKDLKFTCDYGATLSTNSVIGFILSADAESGKFYLFEGSTELELTAVRSTLSAPYTEVFSSTPTGHRVADHSSFTINDYFIASKDIGKAGFSEYFENADRV